MCLHLVISVFILMNQKHHINPVIQNIVSFNNPAHHTASELLQRGASTLLHFRLQKKRRDDQMQQLSWWPACLLMQPNMFLEIKAIRCCITVITVLNHTKVCWVLYKWSTVISPAPSGEAYFLPCQQQVLVHVRAQEACVAVAFHQFIDVVLKEEKKKKT